MVDRENYEQGMRGQDEDEQYPTGLEVETIIASALRGGMGMKDIAQNIFDGFVTAKAPLGMAWGMSRELGSIALSAEQEAISKFVEGNKPRT